MKRTNQTIRQALSCPLLCATLLMPSVVVTADTDMSAAKVFNVRDSGATGDGKTLDTAAIQKALDDCGKAGGGIVRFPAGTYLSKPIVVRTKTTVQLDTGATLQATGDQTAFLKSGTNWLEAKASDFTPFVSAKDVTDVTITGGGTIDGAGQNWWDAAEEARRKQPGYTLPRPNLIAIARCKNLRIENVTLQNSPKYHFVPTECDGVIISNVTILAPAHAANTDAIDPGNCQNVLITKCRIDVGDDNVAIKSGHRVEGREFACENITVTDCAFLHGHGMSIGSETVGGVRNVTVRNCTFDGTENGIRIKSQRGRGGRVENVNCSDITMKDVDPAITLTCYYVYNSAGDAVQRKTPEQDAAQPITDTTPVFRNIRIQNLQATTKHAAGMILGLPESAISNVVLENVRISAATTGLSVKNAKGVLFKNVQVTCKEGPPVIVENAEVQGLEAAANQTGTQAADTATSGGKVFDVRAFGAKGDGETLDTAAIQKALDECGSSGGGTVEFSSGTYLSKPIVLRSSTTMKLDTGAILKATDEREDFVNPERTNSFIPFVGGKDIHDVAIVGPGTIDGSGGKWWPSAEAARRKTPGYTQPRPRLVVITGCKHLAVRDVTLQNGPCMHLDPTDCEDVIISNVTIQAPAHSPNTDAIDPTDCRNVLITKCRLDVGDDDVAIKSDHKVASREFACENITVTDCTFLHGHGMSIGSAVRGGVHDVVVKNCTFQDTENGLRIKSDRRRGGLVENIHFSDITMNNVDPAITLTCYYMNNSSGDPVPRPPPVVDAAQTKSEHTPVFRNIYFNNVRATCQKSAGIIIGLPESAISNVFLENVEITAPTTGLSVKNAKGIQFKNAQITCKEGLPVVVENAQVEGLDAARPVEGK
jgi:polygalacturonase